MEVQYIARVEKKGGSPLFVIDICQISSHVGSFLLVYLMIVSDRNMCLLVRQWMKSCCVRLLHIACQQTPRTNGFSTDSKHTIYVQQFLSSENLQFLIYFKKSGTDRQATGDNITRRRKDAICTPDNSTATMVMRTHLNVKLYMHCLVTHSTVFQGATPYRLVRTYQYFRKACCQQQIPPNVINTLPNYTSLCATFTAHPLARSYSRARMQIPADVRTDTLKADEHCI